MILHEVSLESPVGRLRLVATDDALVAAYLPEPDQPELNARPAAEAPDHAVLTAARHQLVEYFAGERVVFELPLAPRGTDFQRSVWRALAAIPFGETRSYADIAKTIGRPTATRAVGAANGRNPLSIIIPCHRVIGADGSLTGYAGGLATKRWLLRHEGADA